MLPLLLISLGFLLFCGGLGEGVFGTSQVTASGVTASCGSIISPQGGYGLSDRHGDCSKHRTTLLVDGPIAVAIGLVLMGGGGLLLRYRRARAAKANRLGTPAGSPIDLPFGVGQQHFPGGASPPAP